MTHSAARAQGIAFDPPDAALAGSGPQAFFLLAALYGALVLVLWVVVFRLQPAEVVPPIIWHAHEMLCGFAAASAAGMLIALVVSLGAILRVAALFVPGAFNACDRPLLVLPYAGTFSSVGKRVVVAWDGTREATRAVHDALPLIAAAEAVTVVSFAGRESDFERLHLSLVRIVRHLERHDLATRAEENVQAGITVSNALLSRAMDFDADLIVAAAYHHLQFREAVLGGVSRELLNHMTVPVLVSQRRHQPS